jgi:hypothetical protein
MDYVELESSDDEDTLYDLATQKGTKSRSHQSSTEWYQDLHSFKFCKCSIIPFVGSIQS